MAAEGRAIQTAEAKLIWVNTFAQAFGKVQIPHWPYIVDFQDEKHAICVAKMLYVLVFSAGHNKVTMGVFKTHLTLLAVLVSVLKGNIS